MKLDFITLNPDHIVSNLENISKLHASRNASTVLSPSL